MVNVRAYCVKAHARRGQSAAKLKTKRSASRKSKLGALTAGAFKKKKKKKKKKETYKQKEARIRKTQAYRRKVTSIDDFGNKYGKFNEAAFKKASAGAFKKKAAPKKKKKRRVAMMAAVSSARGAGF